MTTIEQTAVANLQRTREAIAAECEECRRDPASVHLIVVTKFQPISLIQALYDAGQREFGENLFQQLRDKVPALPEDTVWHFIGQLQRNKAKHVARLAQAIHSVDRERLLEALADPARAVPLECFLEINLTDDPERGGVAPADLQELAEHAQQTVGIRVVGVMGVAPVDAPAAVAFEALRRASNALQTVIPGAGAISAGMSGDWKQALRYGATHLRIGTAITGPRHITG